VITRKFRRPHGSSLIGGGCPYDWLRYCGDAQPVSQHTRPLPSLTHGSGGHAGPASRETGVDLWRLHTCPGCPRSCPSSPRVRLGCGVSCRRRRPGHLLVAQDLSLRRVYLLEPRICSRLGLTASPGRERPGSGSIPCSPSASTMRPARFFSRGAGRVIARLAVSRDRGIPPEGGGPAETERDHLAESD
jgi:hypothetical protein